jgi:hypothetical protein
MRDGARARSTQIELAEFAYYEDAMASESIRGEHEQATIKAFVVHERQERCLLLLANVKRRKKFLDELGHFRWIDRRFASPVKWKVDPNIGLWQRHQQGLGNLVGLLKARGAGETCWIISEISQIDGQELELEAALAAVVGKGMGSFLSCVPGKLAYFEDEDESLLLVKK